MPDTTLHMHRLTSVVVAPHLAPRENGPFAVVRLDEGAADTRLHVTPDGVRRAREVASALNAACDAVEDAVRRSQAVDIRLLSPDCVPIESLAPDPVNEIDLAPVRIVLDEEGFWDRVARRLEPDPPEAA